MVLVLGIDDAGRGPLIGPMILAGVLIEKSKEESFKKQGVADSKLLEHKKRMELARIIENEAIAFHVTKSYPDEIDEAINSKLNLNTLEAQKAAKIINAINIQKRHREKIKVIVDCPSTNIDAWKNTMMKYVEFSENLEVSCEHKADFNHPVVGAASILAKVMREEEVDKIKKKYAEYGNTGSGYPSDPTTKEFLKKHGKTLANSGIFRKTWATWKEMFPEEGQSTLTGF